jgi:hypothetical protein
MSVHLILRILAAPVTVIVVLVGLWLAGGVLTDDFGVAMWLTVLWMGAACGGALVIARRSRAFRVPVLGAYLVTALVVGAYLGSSLFLDSTVDEEVAVAAEPGATGPGGRMAGAARDEDDDAGPAAENALLREGGFEPVRHPGSGTAHVIGLAGGGRVLTLTRFEVDNGPDLRVLLVPGPAYDEGQVREAVDLGGLKGNRGDQQYAIPDDVPLRGDWTAVIWCRAFSVLFLRAPLRVAS